MDWAEYRARIGIKGIKYANLPMADYGTPKGMKDYSGSRMILRQRMLDAIEKVYRLWGYQPLSTPALEKVQVLEKKCGSEIKGQLFRIEGGKLAMRFDMTVPLARFASSSSLPKPYKRYAIGPVWRKEEPQKGRMREFLQADADIIGCPSMKAEAELIAMALEALSSLGFCECKTLLNNRKILSGIAKKYNVSGESALFRALDKIGKSQKSEIAAELEKCGVGKKDAVELLGKVTSKMGNEEALKLAGEYSKEGADELGQILAELETLGVGGVEIDLSLARGLDYYTGAVFEIKATEEIGSVAGGGRYDGLLGIYGQDDYAVGISLGIERLMAISEAKCPSTYTKALVANVKESEELRKAAYSTAKFLRAAGIPCEVDLQGRNIKKQLDYANSLGIPYAIIIGEEEVKSGKFSVKDLGSGKQEKMEIEDIAKLLGAGHKYK